MSWSIQGLHNNWLEDSLQYNETPSDYWRASEMGKCLRQRFYKRKGIKKSEPFTVIQKRNLDLGKMYHRYYQSFFQRLGILIEKEGEVINDEHHFKGHFDIVAGGVPQEIRKTYFEYLDKEGNKQILDNLLNFCTKQKQELTSLFPDGLPKLLYELKTQNGNYFQYITEAPQEGHVLQIASYLYFIRYKYPDIKEGRILYINKNNLTEVEHIVKLTPDLEARILSELRDLNGYWNRNEVPPQLPDIDKKRSNWQCQYCHFKTYCRGKDWEKQVMKKIKVDKNKQ